MASGRRLHRLQCETEVVPCRRVVRLERQRTPVGGDRVLVAVEHGERESQVVVEFGLARDQCGGSLERWKRFRRAPALIQDDTEVVQRKRLFGVLRECGAIRALGGVDVAAAMRINPLLCQCRGSARGRRRRLHRRRWKRGRCGRRLRPRPRRARCRSAQRAVALLVALAAAAGAGIVASDGGSLCASGLGARQQRLRLGIVAAHREAPVRERRRGRPLPQRDAVADELPELRRRARSDRRIAAPAQRARRAQRRGRSCTAREIRTACPPDRRPRRRSGRRAPRWRSGLPCSRSSSGRNARQIVTSSASTSVMRGSCSASRSFRDRSEKPPLPTRIASSCQNHFAPM